MSTHSHTHKRQIKKSESRSIAALRAIGAEGKAGKHRQAMERYGEMTPTQIRKQEEAAKQEQKERDFAEKMRVDEREARQRRKVPCCLSHTHCNLVARTVVFAQPAHRPSGSRSPLYLSCWALQAEAEEVARKQAAREAALMEKVERAPPASTPSQAQRHTEAAKKAQKEKEFGEKLDAEQNEARRQRQEEADTKAAKEEALMEKASTQGGATPSQSRKQREAEKQAQKEKGNLRILSISLSLFRQPGLASIVLHVL